MHKISAKNGSWLKSCINSVPSSALIGLGAYVIYGWVSHSSIIISVLPGYTAMVVNTALCFMLSGFALSVPPIFKNIQRMLFLIVGVILLVFSLLEIYSTLSGVELGVGKIFITPWVLDKNPFPGRMAFNTSLAFLTTSVIFITLSCMQSRKALILSFLLWNFLIAIALFAVFGFLMKLEVIFSWYRFTNMALLTAGCFLLLAWGLKIRLQDSFNIKSIFNGNQNIQIVLNSIVILIVIASFATLTTFNYYYNQTNISIKSHFSQLLERNDRLIHQEFSLNSKLDDLLVLDFQRNNFKKVSKQSLNIYFARLNMQSILIFDSQKKLIFQRGDVITNAPQQTVILWQPPSKILWQKDRWYLEQRLSVDKSQAYIVVQWLLPTMMSLIKEQNIQGHTRDFVFCFKKIGVAMSCFPNRLTPYPFDLKVSEDNLKLPMFAALNGEHGALTTLDYRNKIVSNAYGPLGKTGLGMAIKMDQIELMEPLRHLLSMVFIILCFVVSMGLVWFYFKISPLMRQIDKKNRQLMFNANHDNLTGLSNRAHLEERFNTIIQAAKSQEKLFAVIFVDVDSFKQINDTYGHQIGDQVLVEISRILSSSTKNTDVVARTGGDEFVIIISERDDIVSEASTIAENILQKLRLFSQQKHFSQNVSASLGISLYPTHGRSFDKLIKESEAAMYKAKAIGKNAFQFCD